MKTQKIKEEIMEAAKKVQLVLGDSLPAEVYEECLQIELAQRGLQSERQKSMPVEYKGQVFNDAYYVDLMVEKCVIVEIRCSEELSDVDEEVTMNYLNKSGADLAILVNFRDKGLQDGVRTFSKTSGPETVLAS